MGETYAFIDGAYLHYRFGEFLKTYCKDESLGSRPPLEYGTLRVTLGASKVFYYDCLDDIRHKDELEEDCHRRIELQTREFERIRSQSGFHVRLGSSSGSRKNMRQKQVDVNLAVEAMHHAFQKNMTHAVILAGDLDFKPVVDLLVQYGIFVLVRYDRSSVASGLRWSADHSNPIRPNDYAGWCPSEIWIKHMDRFPRSEHPSAFPGPANGREFCAGRHRFSIIDSGGKKIAYCLSDPNQQPITCWEEAVLERYLRDTFE